MTATVLIPARGGSKRIERKNLVDLCGKPLVAWSIEAALEADVGPVHVSTDDDEIADVAYEYTAQTHWRAPEAATDDASADDVLRDFRRGGVHGRTLQRNGPILYLQPTSPLRTAADIRAFVEFAMGNPEERMLTVVPNHRRAFFREHQYTEANLIDCGAMYWIPEHRGLEGAGWAHFEVAADDPCALDVDYPWDLAAAEYIMRERGWA